MHRTSLALTSALVATGLLSAAPLRADVRYTITDLGTLGGHTSTAAAINNLGQVVGRADRADGTYHAFLFSAGTMTDLGTLGGYNSQAADINDNGEIVGYSWLSDVQFGLRYHAFRYHAGTMDDLGTFGGSGSEAYAINNHGQIVGYAQTGEHLGPDNHPTENAFLYSGGTMNNLGTFGETDSYAAAINDNGQIVAQSYSVTTGSRTTFLLDPDDNSVTPLLHVPPMVIADINESKQIVGFSTQGTFAYLSGDTTTMANIGSLGGNGTSAASINNLGQIVGQSHPAHDGHLHAFLYTPTNGMTDLNSLIDPSSGWTLSFARDINDSGFIVGQGTNPAGQTHAFLLTPTPEPASLSLLALAATPLLSRRRRR